MPEGGFLLKFDGKEIVMPKKVYIRTFGWPYVQVCRDDFGAVEEDKRFRMKGLGKFNK